MDSEPLFCAEQIKVPDALPEILKEYTKEVIRANPTDIHAWSAKYFAAKLEERQHHHPHGHGHGHTHGGAK